MTVLTRTTRDPLPANHGTTCPDCSDDVAQDRTKTRSAQLPLRSDRKHGSRSGRSPWIWWHLLSLDAPTVAMLWCWFFAACFGVRFPWVVLPTLGLGTWCVYVADRLLDGLRASEIDSLRDRHWFYLRHRMPFTAAWVVAMVPLAYLILFRVQRAVRTDDIALGAIGIAYFLLIHGLHQAPARWFPKELAVGFLFAIAIATPAWARLTVNFKEADASWSGISSMVLAIFTFGAVCWLNCVAIQVWEDAEFSQRIALGPLAQSPGNEHEKIGQRSGLKPFLGNHLTAFALILGCASLCFAWSTARKPAWPLFACICLSSLLLLALIRNDRRLSVLSLRILADAALLTPLLFWLHLK